MSHPDENPVDPRFLLANERTFLAWIRTALGLIAGGLAVPHLLSAPESTYVRALLGVPLLALGAAAALWSVSWWRSRERALRSGEPLPPSRFVPVLSFGVGLAAITAIVLTLLGRVGG